MSGAPVSRSIDLSRLAPPAILENLLYEDLRAAFIARFKAEWTAARAIDPTLPDYDVELLATDPAMIAGRAWAYLRDLDRTRVNEAALAVLAPFAKRTDLDAVVARLGVERLVVTPANPATGAAAIMETDAQLLRRYLLAFDKPSAGSRDRYLYEAFTAWPGMLDAAVIGRDVHGRLGDTDIVIAGPGGRAPTTAELALVRGACTASNVKPEAVAVQVLAATQTPYTVSAVIEVPRGPDAALVAVDATARVKFAADDRTLIGAEVPVELLTGAAYGPNVIRVRRSAPAGDVAANPYAIPVCSSIVIVPEVRG